MKKSTALVISLFILGVFAAGYFAEKPKRKITGEEIKEEEIVKNIANEVRYKNVLLRAYYYTTNKSLYEALGFKVNESRVVFAIIDIPFYKGVFDKVKAVNSLAQAAFKYDPRIQGIAVLHVEPEELSRNITVIYIPKKEYEENTKAGLRDVKLYNTYLFFSVPKDRFLESDLGS